ncbi:Ubiquinol-cytochrome C reductase hinge domain [Arabidopsis suecica]|uniref:Complex III subunit VI n=2 Tax=Arabidopsis TaxID=3701 RepID=A0A8T1ZT03_ARASU|nr:Ubiquinol-cytochrome C reductase hinge domain [Arabidopsis suecica]
MAEEEAVDQKRYFEESCKPKCVKPLLEYQACVKRIQDDESGHKHCTGQYFDYWHCVDKCVSGVFLYTPKVSFYDGKLYR